MWDVNYAGLSGSWNTPTLVRDPVGNRHVFVVGTGLNPATAVANLLTINPANGALLSTLPLGAATTGNKTTEAVAVDSDLNGYDDKLYVCDLSGRLWRVNLTTNPWTVTLLFNSGKPIQATPVVTLNASGQPMIYFGTGRFLSGTDPGTTTQQTLYCITDNGTSTTVTTAQLVNQTSTISAVTTSHRGWYINLPNTGERITRQAALVAGVLYVPTFKPNTSNCGGLGQSWLMSVDYKDGSAPNNANGSENQTTAGRFNAMGDGILADPSVDLVNEDIILQSSNAVVLTQNINVGLQRLVVRSWRQKLQ
jgi:Tfp pilus tip-associated adhesin PilY1